MSEIINLSSYCGVSWQKKRASDQDLPVYQSNFKDLYSVDCLFYQGSEKTNSNNFLH